MRAAAQQAIASTSKDSCPRRSVRQVCVLRRWTHRSREQRKRRASNGQRNRKRFHRRTSAPVGCTATVRLSWRRYQRHVRRLAACQRQDGFRAGASRGNGRIHGERPCKIQRRAWGLHRDIGAGRRASAHGSLRCAPRSHAGAGDRGTAGALGAGLALPAGTRSRVNVQGRGRRLCAAAERGCAGAPCG